jgi:hypothetical protein
MSVAKNCPCGRPLGAHQSKHSHVRYCFLCSQRYPAAKYVRPYTRARFNTLCSLQGAQKSILESGPGPESLWVMVRDPRVMFKPDRGVSPYALPARRRGLLDRLGLKRGKK